MVSIICAFCSGVVITIITLAVLTKSEPARRYGAKISWSRVLPIYGIGAAMLGIAIYLR